MSETETYCSCCDASSTEQRAAGIGHDPECIIRIDSEVQHNISMSEMKELLSTALRAICLTRDCVGEEILPAEDGWEWYDAGKKLADVLDGDEWADEFRKHINRYKSLNTRKVFKIGDWVFGIGEHKGCSMVFEGTFCDFQPFSYLNDFDPKNFRLATPAEIEQAK